MSAWRAISALALLLAIPRSAWACACCDGSSEVEVRGWSADGQRLLLFVRENIECEMRGYLEVWTTDGARTACYDLYSADPDQALSCDADMQDGYETYDGDGVPPVPRSSIERSFRRRARPLSAGLVRARLRRFETAPADAGPPTRPRASSCGLRSETRAIRSSARTRRACSCATANASGRSRSPRGSGEQAIRSLWRPRA